uniref:Putative secreted protein n=1 Tax=Ixodes ricinus TaxID=34613 RepID=A0A6B0UF74_IXORI
MTERQTMSSFPMLVMPLRLRLSLAAGATAASATLGDKLNRYCRVSWGLRKLTCPKMLCPSAQLFSWHTLKCWDGSSATFSRLIGDEVMFCSCASR